MVADHENFPEPVDSGAGPAAEDTGHTALTVFERELDIALLEDEEVLFAGRPNQDKLQSYLMAIPTLVAMFSIVGLPLLPLIYWGVRAFVHKHRYWLTSSRVIVTHGLIGYRARSIPLERISDVALSCNWLERLFGLRSVIIRDMTGEAQTGASMMAVDDAAAIQRQILEHVRDANRRSPSRENERMIARPYREIEAEHQQATMLELLRRIEENTRPSDE